MVFRKVGVRRISGVLQAVSECPAPGPRPSPGRRCGRVPVCADGPLIGVGDDGCPGDPILGLRAFELGTTMRGAALPHPRRVVVTHPLSPGHCISRSGKQPSLRRTIRPELGGHAQRFPALTLTVALHTGVRPLSWMRRATMLAAVIGGDLAHSTPRLVGDHADIAIPGRHGVCVGQGHQTAFDNLPRLPPHPSEGLSKVAKPISRGLLRYAATEALMVARSNGRTSGTVKYR